MSKMPSSAALLSTYLVDQISFDNSLDQMTSFAPWVILPLIMLGIKIVTVILYPILILFIPFLLGSIDALIIIYHSTGWFSWIINLVIALPIVGLTIASLGNIFMSDEPAASGCLCIVVLLLYNIVLTTITVIFGPNISDNLPFPPTISGLFKSAYNILYKILSMPLTG